MIRVIYSAYYGLVMPYARINRDQQGKDILPAGSRSLLFVIEGVFTWKQFHKKRTWTLPVAYVCKLHF